MIDNQNITMIFRGEVKAYPELAIALRSIHDGAKVLVVNGLFL